VEELLCLFVRYWVQSRPGDLAFGLASGIHYVLQDKIACSYSLGWKLKPSFLKLPPKGSSTG
jgi:hypothetical protein